jgi:DNA-binding response OmpR family regulator
MKAPRILLVEDHPGVAAGLRSALEAAGHEVEHAVDAESAFLTLLEHAVDLIVLDVMLPGMDGFEFLRRLRRDGGEQPVLLLTALGQEMDKVRGFRAGADGYAVKPIGVLELQAHVEALLRRSGLASATASGEWTFGDVSVDARTRSVRRAGRPVELSPREFDLLLHLLRSEGAVVPRATLLREVWHHRYPVPTRTVDAHIKLLRAKLEPEPSRPRHLRTVRKVGYRLDVRGEN